MPAGLVALSLVPVLAGSLRLVALGGGPQLLSPGEDYHPAPGPLATHIVCVTLYALVGAFQFAPRFRARRIGWHRVAGRLVVLCGLVGAISGLWLGVFDHRPETGALLMGFRLVFGTAWALFLVLGLTAVLRRDVGRHREWMIRAYAVGLGAGTQVFTFAAWRLAVGEPGRLAEDLLLLAGWLINVVVAEWVVRRSRRPANSPGAR